LYTEAALIDVVRNAAVQGDRSEREVLITHRGVGALRPSVVTEAHHFGTDGEAPMARM
jgi:hypothetical protein